MAKTKDPKLLAVMNLLKARKEIEAAEAALKNATEKPAQRLASARAAYEQAEGVVRSLIPLGTHVFGKWVVRIYENVKKGRRAPSWKGIAEHLSEAVLSIETQLLAEFETAFHEPILVFGQRCRAAYDEGKTKHTKEPTATTETVVELSENLPEESQC